MKNLNKVLVALSMVFVLVNNANAQNDVSKSCGDRYDNLTYEYFYGKSSNVSVNVKRIIASDPQCSEKVLKILANDSDVAVWLAATDNLNN